MKLICGMGINDADYPVKVRVWGDWKKKYWSCPFYSTWQDMIRRCYDIKVQEKHSSYKGCYVCEEWLRFSNFKSWMETQDWEGNDLDKDILIRGNKVYSPQRCVFVERMVNGFILENGRSRGDWPIGVSWNKSMNAFSSKVNNPITKKQENLGYFHCPQEAHQTWLARKLELARQLAALQDDPRVAKALVERYENYAINIRTNLSESQFDNQTKGFDGYSVDLWVLDEMSEVIHEENACLGCIGCSSIEVDCVED